MSCTSYKSGASDLLRHVTRQKKKFAVRLREALAGGDVEAVHDVRVTSRRLDEFVGVIRGAIDLRHASAIRHELREVRRTFTTVRDLDVFIERLSGWNADYELLGAGESEWVSRRIVTERQTALAKAARIREDVNITRLLSRLRRAIHKAHEISPRLLHDTIRKRWDKRRRTLFRVDAQQVRSGDLHEPRVRLKRLRYCTELLYRIELREEDTLAQLLSRSQERLGQWNDRILAVQRLTDMARARDILCGQRGLSAGLLEAAMAILSAVEEDRKAIVDDWRALAGLAPAQTGNGAGRSGLIPDFRVGPASSESGVQHQKTTVSHAERPWG